MKTQFSSKCIAFVIVVIFLIPVGLIAQERTLEELKQEVLERFTDKRGPITREMKLDEVKEVVGRLSSLDRDLWAREWSRIAEPYEKKGDEYAKEGKIKEAVKAYDTAFAYYFAARYPVENSPGKQEAYRKAIRVFLASARYLEHPLERVAIPFEGKEIVGYLRTPKGVVKPPIVFHWGGIDGRKEGGARSTSDDYLAAGWATFVIDIPGTGESPILATNDADRLFSRVIDYLQKRPEIDGNRIALHGGSWGGYWSTKLAYVERRRIRASVAQGAPVHYYFQPEWQRTALHTREYLMDLFPARSALYGVNTVEAFLEEGPKHSLKTLGILEQPSAPLLLLNGKKDTQVPIADLYVPLESGTPKMAWLNPEGGHMGRGPGAQDLQKTVIIPWLRTYMSAR